MVVPLLSTLLFGCPNTPTEDLDLDANLTDRGGCQDARWYARDPDDAVLLDFIVFEIIQAAYDAEQEPLVHEYLFEDTPPEVAVLQVLFGLRVGELVCNPEPPPEEDVLVEYIYQAVSGKATVTVDPGVFFPDAIGTVVLEDVTLVNQSVEADPLTIPSMTIDAVLGTPFTE